MGIKDPTISISIPTFNRYDLLRRTLQGVFSQSEAPDEIIVVDDNSTDGTWKYLQSLKNIKIHRNKSNLGIFGNWNQSVRLAKSDFVVSLHSDDLISPHYIRTWKEKIKSVKGDAGAFISAGYKIDTNDGILGIRRPLSQDRLIPKEQAIKFFWDKFIFYISVTGWTVYKRSIFDKIGYFSEKYGMASENEMTIRILSNYNVYYCATPLFAHREHEFQGFSGKVNKKTISSELESARSNYKFLYNIEKKPVIKKNFPDEKRTRKFLRYPIAFLFPQSLYYFCTGDFEKGREYLKLFFEFYPDPKFSLIGIKPILLWVFVLIRQYLKNFFIRGRKVFI